MCDPKSGARRASCVLRMCLLSVAVSCGGSIGDGAAGSNDPSSAGGTGGGSGGSKAGGPVLPSPDTGLWRLTRTEYSNTVRDLLGDTTQPGNALLPDATFNGFDNNAERLTTDVLAADKYDFVANVVVENALRAGSAARKKLLTCEPNTAGVPCARTIVAAFARRAWRRPVANDEVDRLMTAVDVARAQGDSVEEGLKVALRMALVSPSFLYRVEIDPPGAKGLHPVSPHELATRLSYFVWSSTPDDRLLDLADDGTLGKPDVFAAELARLLTDKKADALVGNFADQWLATRVLADAGKIAPDPKIFTSFNEDLRKAMIGESQAFFATFAAGEGNIADMLDTDFTFANDKLARHYGLPTLAGPQMRQVSLAGNDRRFGLLSQAGFLTLSSNANRTSPVKRGKWVLSRLLCAPPPEPPADVGGLPKPADVGLPANATVRQIFERHRVEPRCASCHAEMDPIGFSLEHYDGIGFWRDKYPTNPIDARGEIPGGTAFDGAHELSKVLKQDPRFMKCFARTMFAYAFGRDPASNGDASAVDGITAAFVRGGGRIREAVALIASSQAFQKRGGP